MLLIAAVVVTAGLIAFAPGGDDGMALPTAAKTGRTSPAVAVAIPKGNPQTQKLALSDARSSLEADAGSGLFARHSWVKPPPPPPKPAPPPPPPPPAPPTAPPLPYAFLGKYAEGSLQVVILTRGSRVITASQGDVLDSTYRVDRIEPTTIQMTYLPMNIPQSLSTGGAQ
jgi:hypothetical protein